ncbi:MAG: hypothetical protein BWY91_00519 [bacterium ADurb.BinA028]|nr:MAG: hypothetical protein BWY91_00519 [bacterium ADurb.BinA028]
MVGETRFGGGKVQSGKLTALLDHLRNHHDPRGVVADQQPRSTHLDHLARGQGERVVGGMPVSHDERGVLADGELLGGAEQPPGRGIGHEDRLGKREDRAAAGSGVGSQVGVEQGPLSLAAVGEQVAADVLGGRLDQRVHQRAPRLGHRRDVEDPLATARQWIDDGCPCASERLKLLSEVFGADHGEGLPGLQHGADPVGPHRALGIVEPRREVDPVQQSPDSRRGIHPAQDARVVVGEGDDQRQ